jgi:hypothetical protein
MKQTITLWLIIIALFGLENYFVFQMGKNKTEIKYRTETDTLTVYRTITDTKIIPKYTTITKIDTVIDNDTIYLDKTQYIASIDTTYESDLVKLKVDYISDIPLSKNSYFNLDLNVKSETVFVPTYKATEPDLWNVGFGVVGHFQDSVNVNLFGNISYKIFNLKHFEMPITAEIELGDNLNIVQKSLRVEGRFKF